MQHCSSTSVIGLVKWIKLSFFTNELNKPVPAPVHSVLQISDSCSAANCNYCHLSHAWSLLESTIISNNITDNIIKKAINVWWEKCMTKMKPWGIPAVTGYSSEDFPSRTTFKPSITKKRPNKAINLTQNSISLNFLKKTNMRSPGNSLGYIKCFNLSSPRTFKSPNNSAPAFLNTRTTDETFNNPKNKIPSDTFWRVQLACMKVEVHSSLIPPPLEYHQDHKLLKNQDYDLFNRFWS